jgi:hypothetical protein
MTRAVILPLAIVVIDNRCVDRRRRGRASVAPCLRNALGGGPSLIRSPVAPAFADERPAARRTTRTEFDGVFPEKRFRNS